MRSVIACAVVALLSLFAAMEYYRRTSVRNEQQPDYYRIGFQEERFRQVAEMLPEEAVVGYVSNLNFDSVAGSAAFLGAQYVLAPRIIVGHQNPAATNYILGNFSAAVETSDMSSEFARANNARVVRDFDAGVVLFRKEGAE